MVAESQRPAVTGVQGASSQVLQRKMGYVHLIWITFCYLIVRNRTRTVAWKMIIDVGIG